MLSLESDVAVVKSFVLLCLQERRGRFAHLLGPDERSLLHLQVEPLFSRLPLHHLDFPPSVKHQRHLCLSLWCKHMCCCNVTVLLLQVFVLKTLNTSIKSKNQISQKYSRNRLEAAVFLLIFTRNFEKWTHSQLWTLFLQLFRQEEAGWEFYSVVSWVMRQTCYLEFAVRFHFRVNFYYWELRHTWMFWISVPQSCSSKYHCPACLTCFPFKSESKSLFFSS